MNTLIHADIFFFITTIVVIVLALALVIILLYVIKILRDVSEMSGKIKQETDNIITDVAELRSNIKSSGLKISFIRAFAGGIFRSFKLFKKRRKKKKEDESDSDTEA